MKDTHYVIYLTLAAADSCKYFSLNGNESLVSGLYRINSTYASLPDGLLANEWRQGAKQARLPFCI